MCNIYDLRGSELHRVVTVMLFYTLRDRRLDAYIMRELYNFLYFFTLQSDEENYK